MDLHHPHLHHPHLHYPHLHHPRFLPPASALGPEGRQPHGAATPTQQGDAEGGTSRRASGDRVHADDVAITIHMPPALRAREVRAIPDPVQGTIPSYLRKGAIGATVRAERVGLGMFTAALSSLLPTMITLDKDAEYGEAFGLGVMSGCAGMFAGYWLARGALHVGDAWRARDENAYLVRDALTPLQQARRIVELANRQPLTAQGLRYAVDRLAEVMLRNPGSVPGNELAACVASLGEAALPLGCAEEAVEAVDAILGELRPLFRDGLIEEPHLGSAMLGLLRHVSSRHTFSESFRRNLVDVVTLNSAECLVGDRNRLTRGQHIHLVARAIEAMDIRGPDAIHRILPELLRDLPPLPHEANALIERLREMPAHHALCVDAAVDWMATNDPSRLAELTSVLAPHLSCAALGRIVDSMTRQPLPWPREDVVQGLSDLARDPVALVLRDAGQSSRPTAGHVHHRPAACLDTRVPEGKHRRRDLPRQNDRGLQ
jgi:hypothetical protein